MSKRDSPARILAKDLIAGCFGGIGIVAVGHPFDTIKVHILRSQLHLAPLMLHVSRLRIRSNPIYTGMSDCIKKTLKWEGVGGLYKGFISPLWGEIFLWVMILR